MAGEQKAGVFINDTYCISPQLTFDDSFFESQPIIHSGNRYVAEEPSNSGIIPGGLLRRMGKAVRMGVGAGLPLINRNADIDAIILGTANGGLEDCLKFLNQIVDYEEGTLTPTNFVQSTPNAVAGSLALMSKNTGYNATHVNKGLAFESALLDALLLLNENKAKNVLLGGIEEISDYNYNIDLLGGSFKSELVTSETLFGSDTAGTVCGEGAAMFVISSQKTERSFAKILDVNQISFPDENLLSEKLGHFLRRNGLDEDEIDALILGYSGDNRNDFWFQNIHQNLFPQCRSYHYKNLVGDYPTSSAFAMWLAVQIFRKKDIPKQPVSGTENVKTILIYNHYKGVQHGFILLQNADGL
jgi:3-oxoacyl-(acyl-carrier-protein) synthase